MSEFWQGITYGAIIGSIITLSQCVRITRLLINFVERNPLPAKATREQLMEEYGNDIAKYKRYTDAEVLRIIKDGDDSEEVIENLSDEQLDRLLAQVTDANVKDDLEMEKLARTIDGEDD